jgi:dihydrofolate reductase
MPIPSDRPPIIVISAMTRDRVIGLGDAMPWDVPAEYAQYREQIRDQTVVMGRSSYEIFGADLTSAYTLVLSSNAVNQPQDAKGELIHCADWAEVIPRATVLGRKIFIAGGSSIYEHGIQIADRMHLSEIHGDYEGDRFFPAWDVAKWRLEMEQPFPEFTYREFARIE